MSTEPFDPGKVAETISNSFIKLRKTLTRGIDHGDREAVAADAAITIGETTLALLLELNLNLNRIAVAQETMAGIASADMAGAVRQGIEDGLVMAVNQHEQEKTKRSFIGKANA